MNAAGTCALGTARLSSPLGELQLAATAQGLAALRFCAYEPGLPQHAAGPEARRHLDQARQELDAYFAGRLHAFSLALDVRGTPFQRRVWQGLCAIPYGTTWSYTMLARHIGRPGACRAVGSANGKNPLPIIIPCHRVVRTGGALGGYSAGLDIKRFLLALERI